MTKYVVFFIMVCLSYRTGETAFAYTPKAKRAVEVKKVAPLLYQDIARRRVSKKEWELFLVEIKRLSIKYNVTQNDLMRLIYSESQFKLGKHGTKSSAMGLIGFLNGTQKKIGKVSRYSHVSQLKSADKYFALFDLDKRQNTAATLKVALICPAAIGKPDSYIALKLNSKEYRANKPLDRNKDKQVTVGEIKQLFTGKVKK